MIRSKNLQPFYLLEMTDTTPVAFNICTKKNILMTGHIDKSQFYRYDNGFGKNIVVTSCSYGVPNIYQKSIMACEFVQINQKI